MGRSRDFQYIINNCVPKCLNPASTTQTIIPGAVFYNELDQNCQNTGQIYIKMDQNCIFLHTIIAWLIFLFAFLIGQFKLKVILSCTWVFHLFSHQWPKTGQKWAKSKHTGIQMPPLFFYFIFSS